METDGSQARTCSSVFVHHLCVGLQVQTVGDVDVHAENKGVH